MTAETPKIRVSGLAKRFGAKQVLDGVSFELAAGESLAIVGRSGIGKSVTLKCILGLIRPDAGAIEIDGGSALGLTGRERDRFMARFGMLFQGGALFDSLTVWENVAFRLLQARGASRTQARRAALDDLALVGLGKEVAALHPPELSGGMAKRVALARAIAGRPEIVFLDEPTTGLDPITAGAIDRLVVHVRETLGVSTVSITHDMASVARTAERVAMLHEGRLIWTGPVEKMGRSGDPTVERFVNGRAEGFAGSARPS